MKKIKFLKNYISDFKYLVENLDLKKFEKFSNMILSIKKKLIFKNLCIISGNSNFSGDFNLQSKAIFDVKKLKENFQFDIDLKENRLNINDVVKVFPASVKLPIIQFLKDENISFTGKINFGNGFQLTTIFPMQMLCQQSLVSKQLTIFAENVVPG